MSTASKSIVPEYQPPGGWKLRFSATGGTVTGATWPEFVKAVKDHLRANDIEVMDERQLYQLASAKAK